MATCNVQTLLANAACFGCLSPGEWDVLELQLLCEIMSAGGGGGVNLQSQTAALDAATLVYSFNHGLGAMPKLVRAVLVSIATDTNTTYTAGREIDTVGLMRGTAPFTTACSSGDTSKVYWTIPFLPLVGNEANYLLPRATDGAPISPTSFNNFQLKIYYA